MTADEEFPLKRVKEEVNLAAMTGGWEHLCETITPRELFEVVFNVLGGKIAIEHENANLEAAHRIHANHKRVALVAALKVAREENARLKRWFADESAHAKEAVKEIAKLTAELQGVKDSRDMVIEECEDDLREARAEIAKLREALALARPYVAREAGWQRTTIGKDRTAVDALSRVDAALAPADKSKGETDGCT